MKVTPAFPANVGILLDMNAVFVGVAAVGMSVVASRIWQWNLPSAAIMAVLATLTLPTLTLANALLSESLPLSEILPQRERRRVLQAFEAGRIDWRRPWALAVLRLWPTAAAVG